MLEIERKYLVAEVPENLEEHPRVRISQGYLAYTGQGLSLRIRQVGEHYLLTVKKGKGRRRLEVEVALLPEQYEALRPLAEGRVVEKVRYLIPYDGTTIELDRYEGPLAGLLTAEVEFDSDDHAEAFHPPAWLGEEVTDDERYRNRNLAVHGRP